MGRVRIADVVRETGVSRATVDRVLNHRSGVHPRTRALVEESLRVLRAGPASESAIVSEVDVLFRLGRGMARQLTAIFEESHASGGRLFDVYQQQEDAIVALVEDLCEDTSRPLVLCVKDTDRMRSTLTKARASGKVIIALISEQSAEARDAFVGIDNRAAGQTAAFLVGRSLGDRHASVGVVLGDFAFRCHEEREIGFRSLLRSRFPNLRLVAEACGEDNPEQTEQAVRQMMHDHPEIVAIYNLSGGNAGLARALTSLGRQDDVFVIAHEATTTNIPLMRRGIHDYLLSQDPRQLLGEAIRSAGLAATGGKIQSRTLNVSIHTAYNIPVY